MYRALLLDGYIDEPTNLGVPPYISTHIRYTAGALYKVGFDVTYITIDQFRDIHDRRGFVNSFDAVVVIAGTTVPGHYLGGTPASITEIKEIGKAARKPVSFIAGPILFGYSIVGGTTALQDPLDEFDFKIYKDPEYFLFHYFAKGEIADTVRSYDFLDEIARLGSEVVKQHPRFPYIICEIETSRGCDRLSHCSFCTEPFYNPVSFRPASSIIMEMKALYEKGVRHFRLGRQANFYAYMGDMQHYKQGFLQPNPEAVETLLKGIREAMPEILTLHIDNVNPGTLYHFPEESAKITEAIVKYCTEGNIASFGVESFDPEVIYRNNLNSKPEYVDFAVRMVNEYGAKRRNGVPIFLPGINLLFGLIGESKETYEINFQHLRKYLEEGLLLRRINIRKAIVFKGTPLGRAYAQKPVHIKANLFKRFKERVRKEIDQPMLTRVFPLGTVLRNVIPEKFDRGLTFARQIGTYPILIGIPQEMPLFKPIEVMVVDYGFRSITGLSLPIFVNSLSEKAFRFLPFVDHSAALKSRPFQKVTDFLEFVKPEGRRFYRGKVRVK